MFLSDEETGGPGGKALAQFAVYMFVAALNDSNTDDGVSTHKVSGSKRQVEWGYLCIPGFRSPPKKVSVVEDVLGMMLSASNMCK